MDEAQTDREAALHAPESGGARIGAGSGAVAVEQLSKLRFRGSGRGANQSVGRGQAKNRDAGGLSPHLYKERKGAIRGRAIRGQMGRFRIPCGAGPPPCPPNNEIALSSRFFGGRVHPLDPELIAFLLTVRCVPDILSQDALSRR